MNISDIKVEGWELVVGWVPNYDALSITCSKPQSFFGIFSFQISGMKIHSFKDALEFDLFMIDLEATLSTIETFLNGVGIKL